MTYQQYISGGNPQGSQGITDSLKQLAEQKSKRLAEEKVAREQALLEAQIKEQTVARNSTPQQKISFARDFYNNKTQVAGPYEPATSFTRAQGTILPKDNTSEATKKTIQSLSNVRDFNIPQQQANTTPITTDESTNPLSVTFGLARGATDVATLPGTAAYNALSGEKRVPLKTLVDTTLNLAQKDVQTSGRYGIGEVGQLYLKSQKVGKYGGNKASATDVGVLGTLAIFDLFGDPAIMIPGLKSARELALWKKTGTVTKDLGEGKLLGGTREIKLNNELKIKIEPKGNKVVLKGFTRRSVTPGENVYSPLELSNISEDVSRATGRSVVATKEGSDIVLTASGAKITPEVTRAVSSAPAVSRAVASQTVPVAPVAPVTTRTIPQVTTPKAPEVKSSGVTEGLKSLVEKKQASGGLSIDVSKSKGIQEILRDYDDILQDSAEGRVLNKIQQSGKIENKEGLKAIIREIEFYSDPYGPLRDRQKDYDNRGATLDKNYPKEKIIEEKKEFDRIETIIKDLKKQKDVLTKRFNTLTESESAKVSSGLKEMAVKKKAVASISKNNEIKAKLEAEKKAYAERSNGGKVTVTIGAPTADVKPVYPEGGTEYQIGEYYKQKELWDAKQKQGRGVTVNTKVEKEKRAQKLYDSYSKIQNQGNIPTEEEFNKLSALEDKYRELTGNEIYMHEDTITTSLDGASKDRFYEDDIRDNEMMFRRGDKRTTIGGEANRTLSTSEQIIRDIETGRRKFSVAEESLKIVRKYKAKLMRNIPGTEGHNIGNIIGHNSLNDPLLLAHELTHKLTLDGRHFLKIISDPLAKQELLKVFKKYYPGSPKSKKTASLILQYNEGMAEFVRQHLFNPDKMSKEFPILSTKFLGDGPLSRKEVSDMYNDMNKLIYIYQNLSTDKQMTALTALDIDFKKEGIKSIILTKMDRIITDSQDKLRPLHILDKETLRDAMEIKGMPFIHGDDGISIEEIAAMARPSQTVSLHNLDPKNNNSKILTHEGKLEELLPFNIGKLIEEVKKNGDLESSNNFFRALADQRERIKLNKKKVELIDQEQMLQLETDPKEVAKINAQVKNTKKDISRLTDVVNSQAFNAGKQEQIIKEGEPKFGKYKDRVYAILDKHLDLMVKDGRVSQETADEWREIPGYAPGFRFLVTDIEEQNSFAGKRSSGSQELKAKGAANEPIINLWSILPKLHISTLTKHNAQMLSNIAIERLEKMGLARKLREGKINEANKFVYAKDGKMTEYIVMDPYIAKSLQRVYGRQTIDNKLWKNIDNYVHQSARTFQKFTTQLNYYFALFKNLALDSWTAPILSETGYLPLLSQIKIGAGLIFDREYLANAKKLNEEYNALTGGDSGIYELSYDSNNPVEVIKKITEDQSKLKKAWNWMGQKYTTALNTTERFTRETEYIRARLKGDSVAQAFEKSRNVSGSFHKTGLVAENVTKYMPFTNSSIQIGYQLSNAGTSKRKGKIIGAMIAIASMVQFLAILKKIRNVDEAQTEEEKQEALGEVFDYLDKSTYEKLNYAPLGSEYKVAISPIISAPGTLLGLLMLSERVPEYKMAYGDLAYQVAAGILPNQVTPENGSTEEFLKSIGGRVVGSFPDTNAILAMAGYKTYPGIAPIENQGLLAKDPGDRYRADTNNLAILLGQVTGISPVNIEAAIKAKLGTGGGYFTDALGSILMPEATKDELGIIKKGIKELLWTSPTKSSIHQTQGSFKGETSQKIYDYGDRLVSQKTRLENMNKKLETQYKETPSSGIPSSDAEKYLENQKEIEKIEDEIKQVTMAQQAVSVVKRYELMGKQTSTEIKNALNRYILAIDSGEGGVSKEDLDRIKHVSKEYSTLSTKDWSQYK